MKKVILMGAITLSLVACKKGETVETTNAQTENMATADSASVANVAENPEVAKTISDSTGKIELLENEKKERLEKFEKELPKPDSASTKIITPEKNEIAKNPDSAKSATQPIVNVTVKPEKVIREKKVIYRDSPKPQVEKVAKIPGSTSAYIEIDSKNLQNSIFEVKNLASQYDADIKSETVFMGTEIETSSLEINIPKSQFSQFLYNLQDSSVGNLVQKNIENSGENKFAKIQLVLNSPVKYSKSEGFGGKTLSAISSGGEALGSIFLFLLPFWPLVLFGAIGYLIYLQKRNKKSNP